MIPFRQSIDTCLEAHVGPQGIGAAAWDKAKATAAKASARIRKAHEKGAWPLLTLPGETCDLLSLEDIAGLIAKQSDTVLVLGVGGSSLGAQTLAAIAPRDRRPALIFPENLDPHDFAHLIHSLDLLRTSILVVSKSGGTPETLAQLTVLLDLYRQSGLQDEVAARVIAITESGDNPLRAIAARWNIPLLDHDPELGGRFSVLSNVGLLPAALAGLSGGAIRDGAGAVLSEFIESNDAGVINGAAMLYTLSHERGVDAHVVMPYVGRLERLSAWYRQLLGESLGKSGKGLTPVAALGPVDQHSMLQLFLDGPGKMIVTLIDMTQTGDGPSLAADIASDPRLSYLAGRTIGDIVTAQANGTADALVARGRPVRRIQLDTLDERTLGALMMHFMLETILLGDMLGVDPFGQPAVEQGKQLTRDYLTNI